jgi:phage protein D
MGKFQDTLVSSGKKIKAVRAKIISENAEAAQEDIVRRLKKEKRDLDARLLGLTDIHPDSELSLKVVTADFDAEDLFKNIHETKVKLANMTIEVGIAVETYDEWFGDSKE